jgi:hypothetical protein
MIRNDIMRTGSDSVQLRPILLLVAGVCLVLGALGCSGGGPSSSAAIAFAAVPLAPPASVSLASTTSFAAVVTGGAAAQGVNWAVLCTPGAGPGASCGTIVAHTASGYPTTFIMPTGEPDDVPVGGTVTVTAASTADLSQTVTATIQVTPAPPISVAFNQAPPASMLTGAIASVIVVVSNDPTNAGDDLSLSCGSPGACGSIVPAHTDGTVSGSNGTAVYTAPLIVPPNGSVTITAASTADPTQSASVAVTITQAKLAIALSQTPPPNLPAGAATNLIALVSFDPNNAGVDWTASCPATSCGSFSLNHTASGQLTTYTAPSTVPPGNVVAITAASTTTPTTTKTAVVTITPANLRDDLLNGQYAFLLQGVREGSSWAIAGTLFADGIGNIDLVTESFLGGNSNTYTLSGTYFVQSDGTGTITLNGAPTGLGYWNNGQQIFQVGVSNSGVISMEEFDGYYSPTLHVAYGGTLTGALEAQTSTSPTLTSASYAFLLSGFGPQNTPAFYGGIITDYNFTMDRSIAGNIDSISGYIDFTNGGVNFTDTTTGEVYAFNYYVVDSGNWILIAQSNISGTTGSPLGDLPAGHLYLQPSSATSLATLCPGTTSYYAFTEAGASPQSSGQGSSPLALGGIFSCDTPGGATTASVTGVLDANINGAVSSAAAVSGSITATSTPTPVPGRYNLTLTTTGGTTHAFALYPTTEGGTLMLQLDPQPQESGVGAVYTQTTGASATASMFSGSYVAAYQSLGAINPPSNGATNGEVGAWSDFLGVVTADGISNLAGSVDVDQFDESSQAFWTQTLDAPLAGNFTAGTQGRFTGSFSISCPAGSTACTSPLITSQQVFYILDSSTVLSLGLDPAAGIGPSTGILQLQP